MSPPCDTTPLLSSPPTYSVDSAIEHLGTGRFQAILLLLAGLCWTAEAMEMLILSFIKLPLQCVWGISDAEAALITTSVAIGMLCGATAFGMIADRYGRKFGCILSTAFTFVFGLISAAAPSYWVLVMSRGLVGVGIGGVPVSFSLLMEFLPANVRGKWGLSLAGFWAIGAVFESLVALLVVPTLGWRWLIVISSMPLGLMLALSGFLVESPRWLIVKGRSQQAIESIERIATINGKELPEGELREVIPESSSTLSEMMPRGARTLALKIWSLWFIVAFVYYGLVMLQPELLANENAGMRCHYTGGECVALPAALCMGKEICQWNGGGCGFKVRLQVEYCSRQLKRSDYMSTLWASVGELPGLLVAYLVIDRIGRRPLLGYMYGICAVVFFVLMGCAGRNMETVLFFVARGASSGAFQSIYVYTNELYPSAIRATAMGVSSSMARVGLTLTPFVSQYVENFDHQWAMWIYLTSSAMAVVIVLWIPIETTGRDLITSMEELVVLLADGEKTNGVNELSFANDPSVGRLVQFFRWEAKVDGRPVLK